MSETDNQSLDEYFYEKPVEIKDASPGMVLADHVFSNEGTILIKKGTVLTDSKIQKIKLNNTETVLVKSKEKWESVKRERIAKVELNPYAAIPVEQRPEFKEFTKHYEVASVQTKKYIMAIGAGAEIKLDELFSLTDGIMNKLSMKSHVLTFLASIRSTDEHTFTHSNNVSLLCNLFSHWLKYNETDTLQLTTAGILHDVGKTKIPLEILNKKGRLTDDEFKIIKTHTELGYKILKDQPIPTSIKLAALMHHEKINGQGYPLRVTGDKIDTFAKIVSICDIYDAMTANRVYRAKICPFEVIRTFERSVYGELDTEFLLIFLRNIAETYVGSPVKLSDSRHGTVMFINKLNLSKPIVRLDNGEMLDLSHIDELSISEILV